FKTPRCFVEHRENGATLNVVFGHLRACATGCKDLVHRRVDATLLSSFVVDVEPLLRLAAEASRVDHAAQRFRLRETGAELVEHDLANLAGDIEPHLIDESYGAYRKSEIHKRLVDRLDRGTLIEQPAGFAYVRSEYPVHEEAG